MACCFADPKVAKGRKNVHSMGGKVRLVDILTKDLSAMRFNDLVALLGVLINHIKKGMLPKKTSYATHVFQNLSDHSFGHSFSFVWTDSQDALVSFYESQVSTSHLWAHEVGSMPLWQRMVKNKIFEVPEGLQAPKPKVQSGSNLSQPRILGQNIVHNNGGVEGDDGGEGDGEGASDDGDEGDGEGDGEGDEEGDEDDASDSGTDTDSEEDGGGEGDSVQDNDEGENVNQPDKRPGSPKRKKRSSSEGGAVPVVRKQTTQKSKKLIKS
jgi:hypothetical protein